ncbi:MAG: fused MFS/spermidine synthase, partial [Candidatus Eremiobacteraeota bacterium]|nr:fused MFS/spermidine synthase [Candidatus Eremiobacteraeota bacterium]
MARSSARLANLLYWSQVFFFFSGATGLIYQVLWTRRLTLTYGHTVLAVSTVLTAFMAGLALGSLVVGRSSDARVGQVDGAKFLAYYGWLEGFIGVWALATLPMLGLVEKAYVHLASNGTSGLPLHVACFIGAGLVLIPPTTAMGGTVPLLTRLLVHRQEDLGRILSRLYGLNTLGAVVGAGLAGFVLLPSLGLVLTLILTALVNLAIGVSAVRLGNSTALGVGPAQDERSASASLPAKLWVIPLCFALAGGASMAYQVAWNRALALSLGSSVYAFS